jgi:hypothetical protein
MNKEEARLSEYDRWAKKHPNEASVMGGFLFFRYLQNERSDLLDFRARDKWQIVHGWIRGRLEVLISLRSAGRQQTSESGKGK